MLHISPHSHHTHSHNMSVISYLAVYSFTGKITLTSHQTDYYVSLCSDCLSMHTIPVCKV